MTVKEAVVWCATFIIIVGMVTGCVINDSNIAKAKTPERLAYEDCNKACGSNNPSCVKDCATVLLGDGR